MIKSLVFVVLLFPFAASAQWQVKGRITDEAGTPLPSATVILLDAVDSSRAGVTATDTLGRFALQQVNRGFWLVKITFLGYRPQTIAVGKPEGSTADLGEITLYRDSLQLDEVIIRAEHVPVVLKKDTVEYNALSYKTPANATVEELLQKMPGITMESDGTIVAQGEPVKRVTVDGKDFFGKDPKLATKNLPADAIEKVQVINRKSEQARFSGIDDGKQEKAINLVLKEDRKNGTFGNAMAGLGHPGRGEAKANIHRFSKDNQLSLLAMANNTDQQGFSMEEYLLYSGAARQMGGGGPVRFQVNAGNTNGVPLNLGKSNEGLMTSYAGGVNVNRENERTSVNGSYFFNRVDHVTQRTVTRENFQPGPADNFHSTETGSSENVHTSNRANLTIDHALDSAGAVRFNGSFQHSTTGMTRQSSSTIAKADGTMQSSSDQYHQAGIEALQLDGGLLYRHKFDRGGRTFSADMDMFLDRHNGEGTLNAASSFYAHDTATHFIDQHTNQSALKRELGATLSYTEPVGERAYLEGRYTIRQNRGNIDHTVYDIKEGMEGDTLVFNEDLSNRYTSDYLFQRGGVHLQLNGDQYTLTAGIALQWSALEGLLEIQDTAIRSSFSHWLPLARLNYRIAPQKRIRMDYETSVDAPTVAQLQPVVDNSNPLNIYTGNPDLEPEYRHTLNLSYHHFNPEKFIGLMGYIEMTYTENAITHAQSTDEQLIRYTTPVNLKDAFSVRGHANLSFPFKKINSRFQLGTGLTARRSVHLLNGMENSTTENILDFDATYNYRYKTLVDLTLGARLNHRLTRYETDQPSQAFLHQAYTAETILNFLKHYQFTSRYAHLVYEGSGFRQEIPLLDLSVSRTLLKNQALEVKLAAVNLLNTDVGVTQTAAFNYRERQTTNSLGRYFMVGLAYTLNKALNPMGSRRGGGMKILRHP